MTVQQDYQTYIHQGHYARWLEEEGRRETWEETVKRTMDFLEDNVGNWGTAKDKPLLPWLDLEKSILNKEIMPSMRLVATAGKAAERDNSTVYNCAYMHMNRVHAFDELMHNLMCGCGQGYSVERQFIEQLPVIAQEMHETDSVITVADSRNGWCGAYRQLIALLYAGQIPKWDLSRVRKRGAKLKTMGGRASGPDPLDNLFKFCCRIFIHAAGRKLRAIEVHDINCQTARAIVVGGVRRSAMIALFDPWDQEMLTCKSGDWYNDPDREARAMANNSAVYEGRPPVTAFLDLWKTIHESGSGEPGTFNRAAAKQKAIDTGRRDPDYVFGTNPCAEIILRDRQFCNLTEVVARPDDTLATLKEKVRLATILGTLQATFTDFQYLSTAWKKNCDEERLLGVSITGIYDCEILLEASHKQLEALKEVAIETNKEYAALLGINQSCAVTCVKPSGTVSQLVGSSSGIHPPYAQYYIRRVKRDTTDPLGQFLKEQGVPYLEDENNKAWVFEFPLQASYNDPTAEDQLDLWEAFNRYWCEHKPSCTIYYTDQEEYMFIGWWLFDHFNECSGLSFFPKSDSVYAMQPYEEITHEEHITRLGDFPTISWVQFSESDDTTTVNSELACTGGACEI